ncbi:allantoin permease [Penicillium nucicola]|uniref:allantoin permease n=1 Tax=Penicillium nucicola TaxID=1850975 RepID=UPI0025450C66|nr:allantoin permease [Penicillium nucicola]KAJ5747326.1 allantoin permease [Penicillium nucicola]
MPAFETRMKRFRRAFSSFRAFHNAIYLESSSSFLVNEDLLPSPPGRQTWNTWSFVAFWWSESWNVSTWSIGSSLITVGASIRDALLVVFFANLLSATIMVLNGYAASRYHIGYPVLSRASFGIYGHYFVIILRSILGIIWGGVQLYFQGQFISICLRCIFPSWETIHNNIPADQHITTQTMVGFFLAFLFTIPFLFVHTSRIQHLFTVKSTVLPLAGLGIVIWATKSNGGVGSDSLYSQAKSAKTSTSAFAWAIVSQFNAVMGSNSALLVTIPDIARYSKTRSAQTWGQLIALPIGQTLCASFGVISTSAVLNMYGKSYWNPYDLLNGILDNGYTSTARAGVFFAAASFAFATLGTSIACNFIPFAADVTCLLPKYLNIVRGQFVCLIIAFAIVPWRIVATANGFLNFLNGYSIFQGPIVAIMAVDYFILRRGNLTITELFTRSSSGLYYYFHGFNIRAHVAFVIGFLLPLPGFIDSFGDATLSEASSRLYSLGWELSFVIGGVAYLVLGLIWPVSGNEYSFGFERAPIHHLFVGPNVVLGEDIESTSHRREEEGEKLGRFNLTQDSDGSPF